jgi:hypothetical protein
MFVCLFIQVHTRIILYHTDCKVCGDKENVTPEHSDCQRDGPLHSGGCVQRMQVSRRSHHLA